MSAVYKAIAAVMGELAQVGIAKNRKNQQQGFNFRGIDDVYNALAPLMARHGLTIFPRVVERHCTERTSAKGGVLFSVTLRVQFDFVAAEDGSHHTVEVIGEAMDSGDKASNKAMSAAMKYCCLMTFMAPTEGAEDADATTHEVADAITAAQLSELIDLCAEAGKPVAELAGAFGLASLADLPAAKFAPVRARLIELAEKGAKT